MHKRTILKLVGVLILAFSACGPSEDELAATSAAETAAAATSTPTVTPTLTPTITPVPTPNANKISSPTPIPIPENFEIYDSTEAMSKLEISVTNFSISVPANWELAWVQDDGITAFSIMSDPQSWQDPNGVWLMIIPGVEIKRDYLLDYSEEFARGFRMEEPSERSLDGNTALSAAYSDGEILTITSVVWADGDPDHGVFAIGIMPLAHAERYRPLIEKIIFSIEIGEEN